MKSASVLTANAERPKKVHAAEVSPTTLVVAEVEMHAHAQQDSASADQDAHAELDAPTREQQSSELESQHHTSNQAHGTME